ncbi:Predicted arabinose efflux permease, MFS family [Actinopolyspora mzabensis]|uniref:Predicted arabinose efflux permease, MFS family n=1 Tax=Actinopolyspora mzabensis TaxID=995066 RepID=A0A1G8Y1V4_ACTMZ|nr:MFS transporter [Actinopolyspora mzabensis]SDJ96723.1 Predicted arabinose efflux permease, MFS family [Actinopolyspora mzabensis]
MAAQPRTERGRTTYGEILAEPEFRIVLVGNLLMLLAETLRTLALSVLVFDATDSALLSAVTFGAGFIPQAIGGSTLTALADRLRPRRLLVAYDLLQTAVTGLLAAAWLPVWAALLVLAVAGTLAPLRSASTGALLPEILAGERYVLGRSLVQTLSSTTQIGGYAVGGVLLALLSPQVALLLAAGGYLLAAALWRIGLHHRAARTPELALGTTALETWRTNVRLLRSNRNTRGLLLGLWLPIAALAGAEATLVAYAARAGLPEGTAGYLLAALPVGMVLGDLGIARLFRPATRARLALPLALLAGTPLLAFAARPGPVVAMVLLVAEGTCVAYSLPLQAAFAELVPEQLRGRGFGLFSSGLMTAQGLGTALVGALASAVGPALAITAAGGLTVTTVLLLRRSFTPARLLHPTR